MPPSSSRRVGLRSRRDAESHQQSDIDTPESISTPSRKRRRVGTPSTDLTHTHNRSLSTNHLNGSDNITSNVTANTSAEDISRARASESMSHDSNATLPNGADDDLPSDPFERQNLIIGSLRTPRDYIPHATYDYANDLQARRNVGRNIEAYAKIAARDWCFFVRKTVLLIGRSDASTRPNPPTSSQDVASTVEDGRDPVDQWGIDIDLGPNRQVSRIHAQVDFDPERLKWFITVNSRNGLKLDDRSIEKGSREPLHSGICIGLLGTQMLFLLASENDHFHPILWRQVRQGPDMEGESDKEGNPHSRALPHAHPSGVTPKRENYDPFPPLSHPRNQQATQGLAHQLLTSTPGRLPDTPLAIRSSEKEPRSNGSPWFSSRGMLIDGVEDIDYSDEAHRDIKPPHSYAQLIGQAILSSPEQMLTLANIYLDIKSRYAFFRNAANAGWQNSIRHNLSLSKSFEKVARRTDEPGKGMKWKIVDSERDEFLKKQIFQSRKGAPPLRLGSSGPSSPAVNNQPLHATERLVGVLGQPPVFGRPEPRPARIKSPPRSATPPLASYPVANESYTPDRGPRPQNPFGGPKQSPPQKDLAKFATPAKRLFHDPNGPSGNTRRRSVLLRDHRDGDNAPSSPPPRSNVNGMRDNSANSPPTLYSDHAGHNPNGVTQGGLVTPLVARQAPRLAPPSTSQVPSQYMNFSSPAPFWKYVDLPSTPARGLQLDVSPIKLKQGDHAENQPETEPAQPSSPPILNDQGNPGEDNEDDEADGNDNANDNDNDKDEDLAPESPTRTVSRPASRAHLPGPSRSRSNSNVNGFGAASGGMVRGASLGSFDEAEEEGEFDLAKGFQKIGSFHRNMQAHTSIPQQPQDGRRSVSTNM